MFIQNDLVRWEKGICPRYIQNHPQLINNETQSTVIKNNIAMLGRKRIPSREGFVKIVMKELSMRMVTQGHEVACCML